MKKILITSAFVASFIGSAIAQSDNLKPQNTIAITSGDNKASILEKAIHVVPTPNQLGALKNEFIAFIHFGPNTFTRMEWGNGKEDPKIFDLKELHTDQWCQAMKAAGMKMVLLTVKHHDGFVLWQSRYTKHGIMSTNFEDGKGDILKNLSASCKKYGLKLGIYLSPADLFQMEDTEGLYGNLSKITKRTIPREVAGRPFANQTKFQFEVDDYNEYFLNQLFEVLTEYGAIDEVWFDGAHPKTKGGQQYNYLAWKKLIHTLAPKAVIFGREDIRWCGNEAGATRSTEWNVLPYSENPDTATHFPDLTDKDLGSDEQLYKAKYLHYQQAETNTSIREGWFYRDDEKQKVRSADDVFDIYERSVGGNSTFLLNIPPNREGKFSDEDAQVLNEVGKRINETYGKNLFAGAKGAKQVLDNDLNTYVLLNSKQKSIEITSIKPVKLNRIVLQENIATYSERVVQHQLEAWIGNKWQKIAEATNIGYKRILRFPEITASKFRLTVLSSRENPSIATISAHYYRTHPPQLQFTRDINGLTTIAPKTHVFGWKPHGENATANLNQGVGIYYTTNGSVPSASALKYTGPVQIVKGEVKAIAIINNEKGALATETFGIIKKGWKLLGADSEINKRTAGMAFDANKQSYWLSTANDTEHKIALDLGNHYNLTGFIYTPTAQFLDGMMEKGVIQISNDGKNWEDAEAFEFGNLINDPTPRTHYFKKSISAKYVQVKATLIAGGKKALAIAELDFLEK
ncbi:alpha-1,3/4-fucosidase [Pedobacter sp. HDW13]|uniref:alpha-L-fucosidase n=1 Tax=unclassified Pedobacter TaxID=2628915 RepID=UPI000F59103A|nr:MULTISPECIES: alpha-L-fucosidase [unclassified Pedobacter]QIL40858.1 alpha-1,3/4-fucosidase [Pedobacter sp. HDW13]RQO71331.1 alpha-1,3/4-fucosidase [Pedobacter sp. KBW01]